MAKNKVKKGSEDIDIMEIGCTGLNQQGGYVYEETIEKLKGTKGVKVYKEMTSEPTIGAILFAMKMLVRNVEWTVEPVSQEPVDLEARDFMVSCLDDMSMSWSDIISEILSFLTFGWSYHEIVYKSRNGEMSDSPSKYDDGRIGWRKIPIRAQDTLDKWDIDDNGVTRAMIQVAPPRYKTSIIPIEKALLFRTESSKGNPEGVSILRSAYRPYYFKKKLDAIEGIGIERDLAGLPMFEVPTDYLKSSASDEQKAFVARLKRIVTRIRNDEQAGLVVPLAYDENGHQLFKFSLVSSPGTKQIDMDKAIQRKTREMAMSVLADFILIGHEKVGSFSLSSSKTQLFATALGAFLKSIGEVFNRYAVPRLFKLNSWALGKLPRIVPGDIESIDLQELGAFLGALSGAGAPLFPDDELESHLRKVAGLPAKGQHTV